MHPLFFHNRLSFPRSKTTDSPTGGSIAARKTKSIGDAKFVKYFTSVPLPASVRPTKPCGNETKPGAFETKPRSFGTDLCSSETKPYSSEPNPCGAEINPYSFEIKPLSHAPKPCGALLKPCGAEIKPRSAATKPRVFKTKPCGVATKPWSFAGAGISDGSVLKLDLLRIKTGFPVLKPAASVLFMVENWLTDGAAGSKGCAGSFCFAESRRWGTMPLFSGSK